ncbi:MAG: pre-peptidase C-terminal domain-containing protein [Pirellulaceae bacterium]|nr:pre-peptidase C-terminal domain-containing protein [Pirellulaceae bacterium]
MAIGGSSKSRKLPAHNRLQKRLSVRRVLLESLEPRQMLAVGPQLIGIQPNNGELLQDGEVLHSSPTELVFRFNDGAGIDPSTLGGIRVIRSGDDGVFERASVATDFNTGGQTLVEFYAQTPGQAGNGIELRFTSVSRNDSRVPILRVSGRTIGVELNSNPNMNTRVEDLLQAFDRNAGSAATNLVFALPLRGSQTVAIGSSTDTTRPLVLSGANSAKGSTNFGLTNNLEVRFIARDSGSNGLGTTVNVTRIDRGGPGAPTITVSGKTINVVLNSNPLYATTAREFVDAINADPTASALIEAQLASGSGATRIGAVATTYSPITLSGVSDIEIIPGYIGLGDSDREVILRFAEPLPDDGYRIEIMGQGVRTLKNVNGEPFNAGVSSSVAFDLQLGAQILSVVPQPVTKNPTTGALTFDRTREIDIYFSHDALLDTKRIISVNGRTLAQHIAANNGVLTLQNTDTIVYASGTAAPGVLDPQYYQLINSKGTLDTSDDSAPVKPILVRYYPDSDRVTLRYQNDLDTYALAGGELRLRVGTNEASPLPPVAVDATTLDPADTFAGATNLSTTWTPGGAGSQSVLISSKIENTTDTPLDFPGGNDEPGNRVNRFQANVEAGADPTNGITSQFYNFQGAIGTGVDGTPLVNAITEQQKQRVREVFSLYERYLGIRFVETKTLGFTVAVGDTRAVFPFPDNQGSDQFGVIEINGPGNQYYEAGVLASNLQPATVLDIQDFSDSNLNGFAGPFQRAAMQGIGQLLGLGQNDEAAQLTIQSFDSAFVTPGVGTELVLPGDADIVHGQYLYRPDSRDVDLYQFSLPIAGQMSIEAFAERMSQASLLDSQIRLFQQTPQGWEEVAANDDYFSSDSYLQLDLAAGNYIVGVSASGNAAYNPVIADTGMGGRSQGNYQLRMDFRPPAQSVLRDADSATGTEIDGDADGSPGGAFNFWFRPSTAATTKFVDKSAANGGNGSVTAPYNNIGTALAAATPGTVVRIVGNGGADRNFATTADNLAYEIGFNSLGQPLPDGSTFDVPKGVTVMIDAGAILKLRRARIGVGSTSVNVDRSGGTLMVLGTPTLQTSTGAVLKDASGNPVAGSVVMTSWSDTSIGKNSTTPVSGPTAGDWGGIDIRARVDAANGRNLWDDQGIFLNWISNVDLRFGGGQVVVDGTSQSITPVQMVDSRPTLVGSTITRSADAALSATPNSFKESNFHSPQEQAGAAAPFSVDYDRVGPNLRGNRIYNNSINGLQVRVRTAGSTQLEKLTVQGRFDDIDVVHYLPENLDIQGTPGGPELVDTPPVASLTQLSLRPGGTLPFGFYTYRFSTVDSAGVEGVVSNTTSYISVPATSNSQTVVLTNIPANANRIYRSTESGYGPYTLVANVANNVGSFVDTGVDLGTLLPSITGSVRSNLDARLAIDGGTIVKSTGSRIDVSLGSQLLAEGTAEKPVVFTSLNDIRYGAGGTFNTANRSTPLASDAGAGNWGGIYVGHTSSASLDHAVIAYGGGTTRIEGGFSDFGALEVHQADLRLAHSRLESNATGSRTSTDADRGGRGQNSPGTIFVRGAQPIIVDNIFSNNLGPAMSFDVSSLNSVSLQDHGRSTGAIDKVDARPGNQGPLIAGNSIQNQASSNAAPGAQPINGLVVRPGNLTTEGVWDDTDVVHVVQGNIVVPDFQHYGGLRLVSSAEQSLVVKFSGTDAGLTATGTVLDNANRIGGSIQLVGTPNYPVVMTSLSDDSAGAGFTSTGQPLVDTNNDGASTGTAGDWRGLLLETYSNDRNVLLTSERESSRAGAPAANDTTAQAQYLGTLAPNEKSGDENQRLGFQLGGVISAPSDVDVYSFNATAGTEVWFDIDRTDSALDTVIELVDANGRTLALSDNSYAEEADPSKLYKAAELAAESVHSLRKSATAFYYQSAQGEPKDLYSTNSKDAGLRIILPGSAGSNNLYHIRIRSSNLATSTADPAALRDPALLHAGLTSGRYQLQVRLNEVDEVPGSGINYGNIRFADTGIKLVGVPNNSPLLGENGERPETGVGAVPNNTFANAQALGNLLATNRQAISVAGNLDSFTDVDWYSFDLTYEKISPVLLRQYFSTIIDVDYADGIGRPDVSLYVFDAAGHLVLGGLGSDLAGDQSSPNAGNSELDRGSAGIKDPFLGPYEFPTQTIEGADTTTGGIPAGRYFLAVTNSDMVPGMMDAYTNRNSANAALRLQPLEGIRLIAEDHIEIQNASTATPPIIPILFPTAGKFDGTTIYDTTNDSIIDYTLGDVVMYVSRDVGRELTSLYLVNPFTGEIRSQVSRDGKDLRDIDFRPNGTLAGFDRTIEQIFPATTDRDTLTHYFTIDTGTGALTDVGQFGLQTSHLTFPAGGGAPTVAASDDGFNIEALTFTILGGQERGFAIGSRPSPQGYEPAYYSNARFINDNNTGLPGTTRPGPSYFSNVIYEFDELTGAATSAPAADKTDLAVGLGAGTAIRDHGYIETFTLDAAGNIIREASELVAREVTKTTATGYTNVIANGDGFVIRDSGNVLRRFEFDLGPEVRLSANPDTVLPVTDGMRFILDGVTYEFDTSAVPSVTPGAVRVPIVAGPTVRQFVDAIAAAMPAGITVSYEAGRMNFGGATTGTFTQLQTAGVLTSLGNPGTPGSALVPVLASDTAQVVAQRIVDAINSSGFPGLVAAVNPAATDRVQLGGGATLENSGPLAGYGVAPGGIITGNAFINGQMYAVSDKGGLYVVNNPLGFGGGNVGDYLEGSYDLKGIQFSGLVEGPVHAQNGDLAQILFGIDSQGTIHAFDTSGKLMPVFKNGATSVANTLLAGATGLAMSNLDFNLWHVSGNRNEDDGHGLPETPNNSRAAFFGGQSLYFGFQSPGANGSSVATGLGDLTGLNATGLSNSYNFAGGAAGAIESAPIDLSSITAGSLPTLYFTYRFDGESTLSDRGLGTTADDYMRDALRVYGAGEDGKWVLLATNNDIANQNRNVNNRNPFDDEFDYRLTGNRETQPLFGNQTNFRQARVPLDALAGKSNVRIRVEFSTYGGFGFGLPGGKGPEIRTISGERLVDGETLSLNGETFEIDMGMSLNLPSASSITNGSRVSVDGVDFVFTDSAASVVAPDVAVVITNDMTATQVAQQLRTAMLGAAGLPATFAPVAVGNRVQLIGATTVVLPAGSPLVLQGANGASGIPVSVRLDMTAEEVAVALQTSLANRFAEGTTAAYQVRSNVVDLTGLLNRNLYELDPLSGQRVPSLSDFSPGPFGGTTNFIGDAFGAFNTGTNADGTTSNGNPGALGAQQNAFEGVYLDDFIIGLAGRGEMALNSPIIGADDVFVADPQDLLANPSQHDADQGGVEILVGPYQFEIRGGDTYGYALLPDEVTLELVRAFEPDALQAPGLAIQFNSAASIVAGNTFTVSDGSTVLTFEMDNLNDTKSVLPGHIAVPYSTSIFDPVSGTRRSESGKVIAARVRDIINSNAIQSRLKVSANLLNNDRIGATSDTVILIGQASVSVPDSIGQTIQSSGTGTSNRARPQGQIVINGTKVSNSAKFGIDIAAPGRDSVTGASLLGTPRNTVTLNVDGLAPGAVVMNSEIVLNGSTPGDPNEFGGIRVSGESVTAGVPRSAIPFVRLVNNTILGGTVTGTSDSPVYTASGRGIVVENNSAATLLNNVIANATTAIDVDASSTSTNIGGVVYQRTVIGGTVFYRNTNAPGNATLGQFPLTVPDSTSLFVDPTTGNLYPATNSLLIDSSIDSLQDRTSLLAVKQPLGIAASPILAPQYDINGQLRSDDPTVESPGGLGENVFKDRGASDRADFVGPSLVLLNPVDNDFAGRDGNPASGVVELTGGMLNYFDIHIVDGIEPSDPALGSGVDPATVSASSVILYGPKIVDGVRLQNQPLIQGTDYVFGFDATNGIIRLTPLAGIWEPESVYTIRFLNSPAAAVTAQPTYIDGAQLSIVDNTSKQTIFELEYGYLLTVPALPPNPIDPSLPADPSVLDGKTFAIDDGARRVVFEIDLDGSVTSGNRAIDITSATTPESVARLIETSIKGALLNVNVKEVAPGTLQIQGSRQVSIDPVDSGLILTGKTGVQTGFGIQIPLSAGQPIGLEDGQTFTINRTGTPVTFEIDTNNSVTNGNKPVRFAVGANLQTVATALVTAINAASIGLTPMHAGGGLITIGGDANTVLDMTLTVLSQSGQAGQPAAVAIPVTITAGQTAETYAALIKAAIDAQNLPGVIVTQLGSQVLILGATSVSGTGASDIGPIRDLAGNPLKANQPDGTTTLTIFQGEGLDYGDAPVPYLTSNTENGPRHKVVDGLSLGATVTPDADARRDDADIGDDGVIFSPIYAAFQTSVTLSVTNTTGQAAYASMWIDFDGNGIFADTERVASSLPVAAGTTTVAFTIPRSTSDGSGPARTKIGETYARVRLSTSSSAVASAIGSAPDGEVEDYQVNILANPFYNPNGILDSLGNGLDVNGDGFVSPIDVLQVINYLNTPTAPKVLNLADATGLPPFVDVNGDGLVTPNDVLTLINYLNSRPRASGEGEAGTSPGLVAEGELGIGEQTVLASNWAGGLADVLRPRLAQRGETGNSTHDQALLDSTEDDSDIAASVASEAVAISVDDFWAGLNDHHDGDESIAGDLTDLLIDDLLGKI